MSKYYVTVRTVITHCVEAESPEDAYDAYHNRGEVLWSNTSEEETISIEGENNEGI